jgi:hypothetical protein
MDSLSGVLSLACEAAERSHEMKSQMRLTRTAGSVGGPGGEHPGLPGPRSPTHHLA